MVVVVINLVQQRCCCLTAVSVLACLVFRLLRKSGCGGFDIEQNGAATACLLEGCGSDLLHDGLLWPVLRGQRLLLLLIRWQGRRCDLDHSIINIFTFMVIATCNCRGAQRPLPTTNNLI